MTPSRDLFIDRSSVAPQRAFKLQDIRDQASTRAIWALLNAYCREVAAPAGDLVWDSPFGARAWPQVIQQHRRLRGGHVLQVSLPLSGQWLLIAVERPSITLNHAYRSAPFGAGFGKPWQALDWQRLARMLLGELALRFDQPFNDELLSQIGNSVALMGEFIAGADDGDWGQGEAAYLRSEQSLTFGHAFHPTPKSREGVALDAIRRYSPELGAAFPLHYFAVAASDLAQASHLDEDAYTQLERQLPELSLPDGYRALPVHPWQVGHVRGLEVVRQALDSGRLLDLGPAGDPWYPTASVRTLFQPGRDRFLKCSLHVRLTNCVRKNAWYELDSAVAVSHLLSEEARVLGETFPTLTLMAEPGFVTADFRDQPWETRVALREAFGVILRQTPAWKEDETPMLAAALFADSVSGASPLERQIMDLARHRGLSRSEAALRWFEAYVERLVHPMLFALCRLGVVFEPHLQNVVVGLRHGQPCHVYIRDLEGTKLLPEQWPDERLSRLTERARDSVRYPEELGVKRIGYCLLINNLAQAVFFLARHDAELEPQLWQCLGSSLTRYQRRHGNAFSARLIDRLLAGEPWPNKTNLLNRVLKRADRASEYVPLASPFAPSLHTR
ncbi:IucA/IucC family protein [Halomonas beimenensis]|uniref:Vibrioferrin amide bond forming protein PvsD n=1 Tax=Halomonas beimenensis TaxID=475662 RepID=A0A291PA15_9GAMM|nr:IucA/IucC family protein [Halomonas beimenensis]ATJ83708.1 vibrioferrin amide bond forming protein PvsD [Halomonas beimenensis]